MPFTTRYGALLDAARRAIEQCDKSLLRDVALEALTLPGERGCIGVAAAAAWAAGLDAVTEKPLAAGGLRGRLDINPVLLASVPGAAWAATLVSCTTGSLSLPVAHALLATLGALLIKPVGRVAQGVLTALSLAAYSIGRRGSAESIANLVWEDDGLGSALFYETIAAARPGFMHRLSYAGLPDATQPCASRDVLVAGEPLARILRVASETSIVYRDLLDGLPRARSLARHPILSFQEAVRVYALESGLVRRRCGEIPGDETLAVLLGCTPGDVIDLAVLASFLSLLDSLQPTLLNGQGETV